MKIIDQLQRIVEEVLWGKHLLEVTVIVNTEDHQVIEHELLTLTEFITVGNVVDFKKGTIIKMRLDNGSLIHFLRSDDLPKGTIFVIENNSIFKLTLG